MRSPIRAFYIMAGIICASSNASPPGDPRLAVCRDREAGVSSIQSIAGNSSVAEACRQALNEGVQVCIREHGDFRRVTEAANRETYLEANRNQRASGADLAAPVRALRDAQREASRQTHELNGLCSQRRDSAMQRCRAERDRLTQERQQMIEREDALRLEAQNIVTAINQARRADANADVTQQQARLQAIAPERAELSGKIPELFSQIQATESGFQSANTVLGQSVLCLAQQVVIYDEGVANLERELAILGGEAAPAAPEPAPHVATNSERIEQLQRDMRENAAVAAGRMAVSQAVGLVARRVGGVASELVFPPSLDAATYHPDYVRQADRYIKWSTFSVSTPEGSAANEAAIRSLERK